METSVHPSLLSLFYPVSRYGNGFAMPDATRPFLFHHRYTGEAEGKEAGPALNR